ncbi:MAG: sialidase family protein, partial [Miltoncostaeaceae bacterium]
LPERTAASGDAVVTWSDVDYSTTPITSYIHACAYSAVSGAWCASPSLVHTALNQPLHPNVTMLPDGGAVAVWSEYAASPGYYRVLASRLVSGAWTAAEVVSDGGSSLGADTGEPAIASDGAGNVLVVYKTGSASAAGPDVLHQTRLPAGSGTWTAPQQATPPDATLNEITRTPSLRMASSGTAVVTYTLTDGSDDYGHAVVSGDSGATWTTPRSWRPSRPTRHTTSAEQRRPRVTCSSPSRLIPSRRFNPGAGPLTGAGLPPPRCRLQSAGVPARRRWHSTTQAAPWLRGWSALRRPT